MSPTSPRIIRGTLLCAVFAAIASCADGSPEALSEGASALLQEDVAGLVAGPDVQGPAAIDDASTPDVLGPASAADRAQGVPFSPRAYDPMRRALMSGKTLEQAMDLVKLLREARLSGDMLLRPGEVAEEVVRDDSGNVTGVRGTAPDGSEWLDVGGQPWEYGFFDEYEGTPAGPPLLSNLTAAGNEVAARYTWFDLAFEVQVGLDGVLWRLTEDDKQFATMRYGATPVVRMHLENGAVETHAADRSVGAWDARQAAFVAAGFPNAVNRYLFDGHGLAFEHVVAQPPAQGLKQYEIVEEIVLDGGVELIVDRARLEIGEIRETTQPIRLHHDTAPARLQIAPPIAWDHIGITSEHKRESRASLSPVHYRLERVSESTWRLSTVVDGGWLTSPDRVFPVTIDPTVESTQDVGIAASVHGYWHEPFNQYWNWSHTQYYLTPGQLDSAVPHGSLIASTSWFNRTQTDYIDWRRFTRDNAYGHWWGTTQTGNWAGGSFQAVRNFLAVTAADRYWLGRSGSYVNSFGDDTVAPIQPDPDSCVTRCGKVPGDPNGPIDCSCAADCATAFATTGIPCCADVGICGSGVFSCYGYCGGVSAGGCRCDLDCYDDFVPTAPVPCATDTDCPGNVQCQSGVCQIPPSAGDCCPDVGICYAHMDPEFGYVPPTPQEWSCVGECGNPNRSTEQAPPVEFSGTFTLQPGQAVYLGGGPNFTLDRVVPNLTLTQSNAGFGSGTPANALAVVITDSVATGACLCAANCGQPGYPSCCPGSPTTDTLYYYPGGTTTTVGGQRLVEFNTAGTHTWAWFPRDGVTPLANGRTLVVGGGGGGGRNDDGGGGGGGGGRVVDQTGITFLPGSYEVIVGGGGSGVGSNTTGGNGGFSRIRNPSSGVFVYAAGGGGGGSGGGANAGGSGGGGGAGSSNGSGGANTNDWWPAGFGNNGGNGNGVDCSGCSGCTTDEENRRGGGGGGGAGGVGGAATNTSGGAGGAGRNSDITGSNIAYGAGGGGARRGGSHGSGGSSCGGAGGGANSGIAGRGCGGGGTRTGSSGAGGRGTVKIRVAVPAGTTVTTSAPSCIPGQMYANAGATSPVFPASGHRLQVGGTTGLTEWYVQGHQASPANYVNALAARRFSPTSAGIFRYDWGTGSPIPGTVPIDQFTSVFNGFYVPTESGRHDFRVNHDDGAIIFFNNATLWSRWGSTGSNIVTAWTAVLNAGTRYPFQVMHTENGGSAFIRIEDRREGSSFFNLAQSKLRPQALNLNHNTQVFNWVGGNCDGSGCPITSAINVGSQNLSLNGRHVWLVNLDHFLEQGATWSGSVRLEATSTSCSCDPSCITNPNVQCCGGSASNRFDNGTHYRQACHAPASPPVSVQAAHSCWPGGPGGNSLCGETVSVNQCVPNGTFSCPGQYLQCSCDTGACGGTWPNGQPQPPCCAASGPTTATLSHCHSARPGRVGCPFSACESAVCSQDSWCCGIEWDSICGNIAANAAACTTTESCPHQHCAYASSRTGCSSSSACQTAVCSQDSWCCSNGWDSICANIAAASTSCAACTGSTCTPITGNSSNGFCSVQPTENCTNQPVPQCSCDESCLQPGSPLPCCYNFDLWCGEQQLISPNSCIGNCGNELDNCSCDPACATDPLKTCCPDVSFYCVGSDSCVNRCDRGTTSGLYSCESDCVLGGAGTNACAPDACLICGYGCETVVPGDDFYAVRRTWFGGLDSDGSPNFNTPHPLFSPNSYAGTSLGETPQRESGTGSHDLFHRHGLSLVLTSGAHPGNRTTGIRPEFEFRYCPSDASNHCEIYRFANQPMSTGLLWPSAPRTLLRFFTPFALTPNTNYLNGASNQFAVRPGREAARMHSFNWANNSLWSDACERQLRISTPLASQCQRLRVTFFDANLNQLGSVISGSAACQALPAGSPTRVAPGDTTGMVIDLATVPGLNGPGTYYVRVDHASNRNHPGITGYNVRLEVGSGIPPAVSIGGTGTGLSTIGWGWTPSVDTTYTLRWLAGNVAVNAPAWTAPSTPVVNNATSPVTASGLETNTCYTARLTGQACTTVHAVAESATWIRAPEEDDFTLDTVNNELVFDASRIPGLGESSTCNGVSNQTEVRVWFEGTPLTAAAGSVNRFPLPGSAAGCGSILVQYRNRLGVLGETGTFELVGDPLPPGWVQAVTTTAQITTNSLRWRWADVSCTTGFDFANDPNATPVASNYSNLDGGGTFHEFVHSGLQPNTCYDGFVRSRNDTFVSAYVQSNSRNATRMTNPNVNAIALTNNADLSQVTIAVNETIPNLGSSETCRYTTSGGQPRNQTRAQYQRRPCETSRWAELVSGVLPTPLPFPLNSSGNLTWQNFDGFPFTATSVSFATAGHHCWEIRVRYLNMDNIATSATPWMTWRAVDLTPPSSPLANVPVFSQIDWSFTDQSRSEDYFEIHSTHCQTYATCAANAYVDLNTADATTLQTLPNIGATRAANIIQDRIDNGPFPSVEDITRVGGIGAAVYNGLCHRAMASQTSGEIVYGNPASCALISGASGLPLASTNVNGVGSTLTWQQVINPIGAAQYGNVAYVARTRAVLNHSIFASGGGPEGIREFSPWSAPTIAFSRVVAPSICGWQAEAGGVCTNWSNSADLLVTALNCSPENPEGQPWDECSLDLRIGRFGVYGDDEPDDNISNNACTLRAGASLVREEVEIDGDGNVVNVIGPAVTLIENQCLDPANAALCAENFCGSQNPGSTYPGRYGFGVAPSNQYWAGRHEGRATDGGLAYGSTYRYTMRYYNSDGVPSDPTSFLFTIGCQFGDEGVCALGIQNTVDFSAADDRIDINEATAAELQALPGIGASLANAIVNYRNDNGPFVLPEDLMNVSGIGTTTFANLCDQIRAGDILPTTTNCGLTVVSGIADGCVYPGYDGFERCDGVDWSCSGEPNTEFGGTTPISELCYEGPDGTVGVGICEEGERFCIEAPEGSGVFVYAGECVGQVLPEDEEVCDPVDNTCTGDPYDVIFDGDFCGGFVSAFAAPGSTSPQVMHGTLLYADDPGRLEDPDAAGVFVCVNGTPLCDEFGLTCDDIFVNVCGGCEPLGDDGEGNPIVLGEACGDCPDQVWECDGNGGARCSESNEGGGECEVPGAFGLCAIGELVCGPGGTVCVPTYVYDPDVHGPAEFCDLEDIDCDGDPFNNARPVSVDVTGFAIAGVGNIPGFASSASQLTQPGFSITFDFDEDCDMRVGDANCGAVAFTVENQGNDVIPADALVSIERIATDNPAQGLWGEYFIGENFEEYVFGRHDSNIDFNWAGGSPDSRIPNNSFSVRWRGTITPPATGEYTFIARTDDGARLFIDGKPVINYWQEQSATDRSGTIHLQGGQPVAFAMFYYEADGQASARLSWEGPGITGREIVPTSAFSPHDGRIIGQRVQLGREIASQATEEFVFCVDNPNQASQFEVSLRVVLEDSIADQTDGLACLGTWRPDSLEQSNPYGPVNLIICGDEVCDGYDNNLNGVVNEMPEACGNRVGYECLSVQSALCGPSNNYACPQAEMLCNPDLGHCFACAATVTEDESCHETGCGVGEHCHESGICVPGCSDAGDCAAGERCVDGACVDASWTPTPARGAGEDVDDGGIDDVDSGSGDDVGAGAAASADGPSAGRSAGCAAAGATAVPWMLLVLGGLVLGVRRRRLK